MNFLSMIDGKVGILMAIMGTIAVLFTVAPILVILFYEIGKFSKRGSEYTGAKSAFSFIFVGTIVITISGILYYFLNVILDNFVLVKYAPMGGDNGLTRAFWLASKGVNKLGTEAVTYMSVVRMLVPTLLIVIAIFFIVLSVIATFSTINAWKADKETGGNIFGVLLSSVMGISIGMIVFYYYSQAISGILNAPNMTIVEIINGWFADALKKAIH